MNDLKRLIKSARYPAALTGAGISAPSGIPTFQGSYKGRPLRDYLTRDYMEDHPIDFFDLYCDMVKWCEKEPNLAHYALKELNVRVITQNIDGLHAKAGSADALEMHGSLRFVLCHGCGWREDSAEFAARYREARAQGDEGGAACTALPRLRRGNRHRCSAVLRRGTSLERGHRHREQLRPVPGDRHIIGHISGGGTA